MKIAYLMQHGAQIRRPPFDGPALHVRHVIQELMRRGHQVRLLMGLEGRIWKTDNLTDIECLHTSSLDRGAFRLFERVTRRLQSELGLPYAAFFESMRFAQACHQEFRGFDLLYERVTWPGYGGALAMRRLRIPLVLEDNGDQLVDLDAKGIAPQGLQRRLSTTLMRWAIRHAAHVVSTGSGWQKQFQRRWGYPAEKTSVVENGTHLVYTLARAQLRSFTNAADDSTTPVTLVYLGGFQPWHGISVLLSAFAQALASGAVAQLMLIGAGEGLDKAREMVTNLNLEGKANFTGQLRPEEYAPLLARADVGVAPYCRWPEFSGLKILDYKAAGLATIASGRDGCPSTLTHGDTGLIVPPCDKDALSRAIVQMCTDARLRKRMGQAARLEAEQRHGWEHTVSRLEQLFLTVTAAQASHREVLEMQPTRTHSL